MDRKEFLKSACGAGICGCAFSWLGAPAPAVAEEPSPEKQQLAFARYQVAKMVGFLGAEAPAACAAVLEKTGRECAKLGTLVASFKGNPEGYFTAATKAWGTEFLWDKPGGMVTVTVAPGECGCPLVDARRTPAVFCNCSVGYQKEAFETVFGRPVEANLKASKLDGSPRCVFEVKLA